MFEHSSGLAPPERTRIEPIKDYHLADNCADLTDREAVTVKVTGPTTQNHVNPARFTLRNWLTTLDRPMKILKRCLAMLTLVIAITANESSALAQRVNYEEPPISYSLTVPENAVSKLQAKLDAGQQTLQFEDTRGYLKSLLKALDISPSSQVLSFSRTSLQDDRISPATPRAIYFNDEVHVGFVQGGLIEIAAHDPELGVVFYSLRQDDAETPVFQRQTNSCLTCHGAARTGNVPGLLVRSVYPDPDGHPVVAAGSFLSSHKSPLSQRWGGWYVTGTHGEQVHLGNFTLTTAKKPKLVDNSAGHNLTDLKDQFDRTPYLTPHSDIVALMVLEHQTDTLNVLTQASFEVRHAFFLRQQAAQGDAAAIEASEKSCVQRLQKATELVVRSLLFSQETKLTAPIAGTSTYARDFAGRGRKDSQGRNLREFDLTTRMFRYPCSYLIQTPAFDKLPEELKSSVGQRMKAILNAQAPEKGFEHLTADDSTALLAILAETNPGLIH